MSDGRPRTWHTPEGVPLTLVLAPLGARAAAFMIDGLIIVASTLALVWVMVQARSDGALFRALFMLLSFGIRTFYFAAFELFWQGQTPGKRLQGIRVVAGAGGPLTPRAVFARNLTRELETFLPLVLLAAPELLYGPVGEGQGLLSVLWILVFLLLPFFNREGLRVGDLIAGTRVVRVPKAELLADVSEAGPRHGFAFTGEHLRHYGERELKVLEDVLRDGERVDANTRRAVAERIHLRVGYPGPLPQDVRGFLTAFYTAQRAHLERGRLLGQITADKRAARSRRS